MGEGSGDAADGEAVSALTVRRWRDGAWSTATDHVAAEVPVQLAYNSIPHVVMMCTPRDLADLGRGFTVSEGLVANHGEVRAVEVRREGADHIVNISVSGSRLGELLERRRNLTGRTGCGVCGAQTIEEAIRRPPRVAEGGATSRALVVAALARLRELQPLGRLAGSLHAAAWVSWEGVVQRVREDVGRHNALDKLIGAGLREDTDFAAGYVIVTSRASYEMVQKAATLGIRLLVAVSAPTALGVQLAHDCGMTLVGFAREDQQVVYSNPDRLHP